MTFIQNLHSHYDIEQPITFTLGSFQDTALPESGHLTPDVSFIESPHTVSLQFLPDSPLYDLAVCLLEQQTCRDLIQSKIQMVDPNHAVVGDAMLLVYLSIAEFKQAFLQSDDGLFTEIGQLTDDWLKQSEVGNVVELVLYLYPHKVILIEADTPLSMARQFLAHNDLEYWHVDSKLAENTLQAIQHIAQSGHAPTDVGLQNSRWPEIFSTAYWVDEYGHEWRLCHNDQGALCRIQILTLDMSAINLNDDHPEQIALHEQVSVIKHKLASLHRADLVIQTRALAIHLAHSRRKIFAQRLNMFVDEWKTLRYECGLTLDLLQYARDRLSQMP